MTDRYTEFTRPAADSLSLFQRLQLGLLMLLVTACGALSAAAWQAVERFDGREAAHERELNRFHADLVLEMRRLAENSGMLTSADLCVVRFRLRHKDQWNHPIRSVEAVLTRLGESSRETCAAMGPDGVVNFGLIVPGRYRLELTNASGYGLEHEFDVLAGVPVDRLVLCPLSTDVSHLATRIDPVQAPALRDRGLVTRYYIERDDIRVGEWTWQPRQRGGVWVAPVSPAAGEIDLGTESSAVPYVVARCAAVAVYRTGTDGNGTPELLGTFRFRPESEDVSQADHWPQPVFAVDGPPLRYQGPVHERTSVWRIELPPELTDRIEGLRNGDLSNPGGRGSQWPSVPAGLPKVHIVPRT